MSILGIEIGITGCRAVVFSARGRLLGSAYRGYLLQRPESGARELDATEVMARTQEAIIAAVDAIPGNDPVQALAVASQGEAIVPVDREGHPLGPALTTFDSRPTPEAYWVANEVGHEHLHQLTGLPLHPMYSLVKLLWWKRHRPDILAKAWKCLTFGDLLLAQLGFDPVMDYSMAGRTMALDMRAGAWSDDVLDAAGISRDLLPGLAQAGTSLGSIPDHVAARYHLPAGVQAVVGGHDQACMALGCGVTTPGMVADALGAVECLAAVLDTPVINDRMRDGHYGCYPHVVPGRYVTLAYNFSGGALLHWFRETLGQLEEEESRVSGLDFFEILIGKATHGPAGVLVLPYFTVSGTPWLDAQVKGAMVGLTLETSKAEIIKGLLDGLTYEMRLNLERLAEAGVNTDVVRVIGGQAESATWRQLKADIYRRPVEGVTTAFPTCLGASLLAGVGAGIYESLTDAVRQCVSATDRVAPHPDAARYQAYYDLYTRLYPALKPILHDLP